MVGSVADKMHSYIILVALYRQRKILEPPKKFSFHLQVNPYLKRSRNGKLPIYHSYENDGVRTTMKKGTPKILSKSISRMPMGSLVGH